MEYRKQILYREFTDYSADILALQEVEEKFFQNELLPFFETVGMTGVYSTLNARRLISYQFQMGRETTRAFFDFLFLISLVKSENFLM